MRYGWIYSALLGLSLIQCSSSEKKAPQYPDTTSFCEGMANAECSSAVLSACSATNAKQNCLDIRKAACVSTYVTPSAGLTYDPVKAENCVNVVRSVYSNATIKADQFASITAACGVVFSGSGTKGASCEINTDCKQSDGLACVIHAQGSVDAGSPAEGTCQVPVTVAAGESCSAVEDQCDTDHYCDPGMHCVASGVLGDNCSAAPCKSQFRCTNGTCVAKLAESSQCTSSDECASGLCAEDVKRCITQLIFAPSEPFCVAIFGHNDAG